MNVADVAHGVREFQFVAEVAINCGGFFVGREGRVTVAEVTFDAAQFGYGLRQGARVLCGSR
jgi:hypothetical protein